uniref:Protein kinase domain-containing protein n=1 Tax=viral metagenome TaxID=1070528 RepID=A0A6C0M0R2_9ZZZZ
MGIYFLEPLPQKFKLPIEIGRFPGNVYVFINKKDNIVIKYFAPYDCSWSGFNKEYGGCHKNELFVYQLLMKNKCKQCPKLLGHCYEKLYIKMELCNTLGNNILILNWERDLNDFFNILNKEQILAFDMKSQPILSKNGHIKFIDFGLYKTKLFYPLNLRLPNITDPNISNRNDMYNKLLNLYKRALSKSKL